MSLFSRVVFLLLFSFNAEAVFFFSNEINGAYVLSQENRSEGCMESFVVEYDPMLKKFSLGFTEEELEFHPFDNYHFLNVNAGKKLSHLMSPMGWLSTWEENSITAGDKIIFTSLHTGRKTSVEFRKVTLVFSGDELEMVDTHNSSGLCLYKATSSLNKARRHTPPDYLYLKYL